MSLFVCLDGAGGYNGGNPSDCLLQVVLINPGIESLDCCGESVLKDHVGTALALEVELCWVDIGVA